MISHSTTLGNPTPLRLYLLRLLSALKWFARKCEEVFYSVFVATVDRIINDITSF